MKFLLASLLTCTIASTTMASMPHYEEPEHFNFHLYSGFREDNLQFRLVSKRQFPWHSAKAKWSHIRLIEVGASFDNATCPSEYYIRANADYGWVFDGHGHNYAYDKRFCGISSSSSSSSSSSEIFCPSSDCCCSSESSISGCLRRYSIQSFDTTDSYVADLITGIGWKAVTEDGRGWIAGVGGYSYHRQNFNMTNFEQEKDVFDLVNQAEISQLKTKYVTEWMGPWVGIDYLTKVECDVTWYGSVEWHWARFRGNGDWNLNNGCNNRYKARFRHRAVGYGVVARTGVDWQPCDCWAFGICGDYQNWSTRKGKNRAKIHDNLPIGNLSTLTFPIAEKAKLRRAKWNSYTIMGTLAYRF